MTSLFQRGDFILHSGQNSSLKIDCDALTDTDIDTIAWLLWLRLPGFGSVEGIPRGGLRLATALEQYVTMGHPLIVDDVYTTGRSMEAHRGDRITHGAVIFARREPPPWIIPLLSLRKLSTP